jgi:hypothetical protein
MSYVPWVYPTPGAVTPPEPLMVTTTFLPSGREDAAYVGATLTATGGTPPYTWAWVAPNDVLPTGTLALTGATGVLAGTPTSSGTFELVARATDSAGSPESADSGILSLVIDVAATGALTILTTELPNGKRGDPYSTTVAATGGTPPYAWVEVAPYNVWPTGIDLVGTTNVISGTPTVFHSKDMRLRVTDSAPVPASVDSGLLPIIIDQVDAPVISTSRLPQGEQTVPYSYTFPRTGGWGPFTWAKLSGSYPAGSPAFSLNASTGELTGTPTTVETAVFEIQVTDSEGRVSPPVTYSLNVVAEGTIEGPFEYWTYLQALPTWVKGWDLRSEASLKSVLSTGDTLINWSYDPVNDTYPLAQDAGKLTLPAGDGTGKLPLYNSQLLRFEIGLGDVTTRALGSTVVLTWDWFPSQEFRDNYGGITHIKMFQVVNGSTAWWTMMESPAPAFNSGDPTAVFKHSDEMRADHSYGGPEGLTEFRAGIVPSGANTPLQYPGQQQRHTNYHSRWIRYWVEIRQGVPHTDFTDWNTLTGQTLTANPYPDRGGLWFMMSLWIADEFNDAQRVVWRVPMNNGAAQAEQWVGRVRFEFDSSKTGWIGPAYGYVRNFAVLHGANLNEADPDFFRRPAR